MAKIYISGQAGKIEGMFHQSESQNPHVALVLHPHPLYGGTMNNKVVYHLYKLCINMGFSVLRINFRGVGNSQGTFDNGLGELADVYAALDWLHENVKNASSYWILGFSFGTWIGMHAIMRRPEIEGFIMAAPPISRYDFNFFIPCPVSGLIIQGSDDEISRYNDTSSFVDQCNESKSVKVDYHVIDGSDHFFKDRLDEFDSTVQRYLEYRMENRIIRPIVKQRKRSKNKKKSSEE